VDNQISISGAPPPARLSGASSRPLDDKDHKNKAFNEGFSQEVRLLAWS